MVRAARWWLRGCELRRGSAPVSRCPQRRDRFERQRDLQWVRDGYPPTRSPLGEGGLLAARRRPAELAENAVPWLYACTGWSRDLSRAPAMRALSSVLTATQR
jgi:hypothetical protein